MIDYGDPVGKGKSFFPIMGYVDPVLLLR